MRACVRWRFMFHGKYGIKNVVSFCFGCFAFYCCCCCKRSPWSDIRFNLIHRITVLFSLISVAHFVFIKFTLARTLKTLETSKCGVKWSEWAKVKAVKNTTESRCNENSSGSDNSRRVLVLKRAFACFFISNANLFFSTLPLLLVGETTTMTTTSSLLTHPPLCERAHRAKSFVFFFSFFPLSPSWIILMEIYIVAPAENAHENGK